MKTTNKLFIILFAFFIFSCSKQENIDMNNQYNNMDTYPRLQKDSTQAIESITKLKLQQVLDLSVLYSKNNRDKEIDSALYNQLLGYFYEPDSLTLRSLIHELDSLKVDKVSISNLENKEIIKDNDTLNFVRFKADYFNTNKEKITEVEHEMQYIFVLTPIKFKKEFKFYFLNYLPKPSNDSTRLGETK